MENSPQNYEDDEEDDSNSKYKKTRLGLFAISNEKPDEKNEEGSWFSRLTESKPDEKEKPKEVEEAEEEEPKPKLEVVETPAEEPLIAEVEPVSETEAPLEEASTTEIEEVVRPKLVEVIEEIEADQEPDPITDPPVDKFRDLVKSGEEPDAAFDEVMADMEIEESEIAELDAEEPPEKTVIESDVEESESDETEGAIEDLKELDNEAEEPEPDIEPEAETEPEIGSDTVEAVEAEQDMEEEPEDPQSAGSNNTIPPAPPAPPSGNTPPAQPLSPPPPGFQPPPFGSTPPGGHTPNVIPTPPAQDQNVLPKVPEYHEASPAAMALFGGIIGYLIGRRRGRINTEKKLLPLQKKLEKQVEDMQFELQEKEKKIRRIAAAKVEKSGPQVIESFKKKQKTEQQPDKDELQAQTPEISVLQAVQSKPEHLGHIMVKAESKPASQATPESRLHTTLDKTIDPESTLRTDRHLETLNRTELLAISEKIIIDGSTLRQIFETHLIGESGLRRIIAEQMRGGDLKKALQMEIVEREIDFERDPGLRDINTTQQGGAPVGVSGGNTALNNMLEKASASIGGNEEAAFIRARAAYEADQTSRQLKKRSIIDITFATIIAVLICTVIYLIISRM